MTMIETQRQYQMALEAHRYDPDDEVVWKYLQKVTEELEIAWAQDCLTLVLR